MPSSINRKYLPWLLTILACTVASGQATFSQTGSERSEKPKTIQLPGQPPILRPTAAEAARIAQLRLDHYEILWKGKPPTGLRGQRGQVSTTFVSPEELVNQYESLRDHFEQEHIEAIVLYGTKERTGALAFLTADPALAEVQQARSAFESDIYLLSDFNHKLKDPSVRIKVIGEVTIVGLEEVDGERRLTPSSFESIDGEVRAIVWRVLFETGERIRTTGPPGRYSTRAFAPPSSDGND